MIKKRSGQSQPGQNHSRSEKSLILETLKEVRNISSKKHYRSRRRGTASEKCDTSEQIDLRLEILRKKYRCELNRTDAFDSYLKAVAVEKNMVYLGDEEGEFVSKINVQVPHPIAALLSKQIELENLRVRKIIRAKNAKKKIHVHVDAIWEGVKGQCERIAPSSFCQLRSVPNCLIEDEQTYASFDMEIQSMSSGPGRSEKENLDFGGLESISAEQYIAPEHRLPKLPSHISSDYLDVRLVQYQDWSFRTSDSEKKMKISVVLKVDKRKLDSDQPQRSQWSVEIFDPSKCIPHVINYSGEEVCELLDVTEQEWNLRKDGYDAEVPVHDEYRDFFCEEEKISAFCSVRVYHKMKQIWIRIHMSTGNDFKYDMHFTTCEAVARLPMLHLFAGSFDFEFWSSSCNGINVWSPLLGMLVLQRDERRPSKPFFEFAIDQAGITENVMINEPTNMAQDYRIDKLRSVYPYVYAIVNDIVLSNDWSSGQCLLSSRVHEKTSFIDYSHENIEWIRNKRCQALLSLQKHAHATFSNHLFPGCAFTEMKGMWWDAYSHIGQKIFIARHHSANHPDYQSRPVTVFRTKSRYGPMNAITAMTITSPLHVPLQRAIDEKLITPINFANEESDSEMPKLMAKCKNLLTNCLRSVVDERQPSPVSIKSSFVWDDCTNPDHRPERQNDSVQLIGDDSFRRWCIVDYLKVDRYVPSLIFGISKNCATPNESRMCATSIAYSNECCNDDLSRRRGYRDMLRLIRDKYSNNNGGNFSEASLFSLHMSAYELRSVSRSSLGENRNKCDDLKLRNNNYIRMISNSNKLKSGLTIHEEKCAEEIKHIRMEIQTQKYDESAAYHNVPPPAPRRAVDSLGSALSEKYPSMVGDICDCRTASASDTEKQNDMDHSSLFKSDQLYGNRYTNKALLEEGNDNTMIGSGFSKKVAIGPTHVPKLRIPHLEHQLRGLEAHSGVRGRGWRLLSFGNNFFELNKHKVEKCCSSGIFQTCNKRSIVGSVDPVKEIDYIVDESLFSVSFNHLFVEDVMSDINKLIEQKEKRKTQSRNFIDMSTSSKGFSHTGDMKANDPPSTLTEEDIFPTEDQADMTFKEEQKAILAVKNSNMPMLEQVLDIGINVDTKDEHGNTLLILCCQQGNKRMSKFLLRRGAFINAQNNMGNTILHYLYEYQHTMLAEYLMTKGADDKILNAEGLTCYEGLNRSKLDEL
eukprot:CAMPEP_0116019216 /NCGR_PEP_ID=MMETSP0321-20121206/9102_1 /TAXON_ID=163516 /ORGANISM="Leptocylindrus danicus var. danicus, Strain B650" /LENGTH=1201 /DNA_ID=CAMNT_0003489739 /DNA_START=464 /DNA_END=4069 /DNA_ORIENTATION=-